MVLTKAEKLGYLVRSFKRQRLQPLDGETNLQFAQRVVNEKVSKMRLQFLRQQIQMQIQIEQPVQEELDVSDL